jgi:hypothetical protein
MPLKFYASASQKINPAFPSKPTPKGLCYGVQLKIKVRISFEIRACDEVEPLAMPGSRKVREKAQIG